MSPKNSTFGMSIKRGLTLHIKPCMRFNTGRLYPSTRKGLARGISPFSNTDAILLQLGYRDYFKGYWCGVDGMH